jgi:microcystin-dependent protein
MHEKLLIVLICLIVFLVISTRNNNKTEEKFTQIPSGFTNIVLSNTNGDLQTIDFTSFLNNSVPKGIIVAWTGNDAPKGWSLCDGNNGTPDLRGRFILGTNNAINGLSKRNLGDKGGAETHTLTIPEMPAHSHSLRNAYNGGGTQNNSSNWDRRDIANIGMNDTTFAGGNQPHNYMPPFYVLAYIMKI